MVFGGFPFSKSRNLAGHVKNFRQEQADAPKDSHIRQTSEYIQTDQLHGNRQRGSFDSPE